MRRSAGLFGALVPVVCLVFASSASAAPTLAAAGDIACAPGSLPTGTACEQNGTAAVVQSLNPTAVAALGDVQYESGSNLEFAGAFNLSWGGFKSLIHPAVGNHEYLTSGAAGYFGYFGGAAGEAGKGYYSYDLGAWHLIALNSNCEFVSCAAGSPQEQWLRADLASHPAACTLAYWHHPLFTSGQTQGEPDNLATRPLWQALYQYHASLVLAGHDHDYERFAPQDSNGKGDPNGIREFVVGTGGRSHISFSTLIPNSEVRNAGTFGVLLLTLNTGSYSWSFVPENAGGFTDQGSGTCVGPREIPGVNGPKRSTRISRHGHGKKRDGSVALRVNGRINVAGGSVIAKPAAAAQFTFPLHLCGGKMRIKVKLAHRSLAKRTASVRRSSCRWLKRLKFPLSKLPARLRSKGLPVRLKVSISYRGDRFLRPSRARPLQLTVR